MTIQVVLPIYLNLTNDFLSSEDDGEEMKRSSGLTRRRAARRGAATRRAARNEPRGEESATRRAARRGAAMRRAAMRRAAMRRARSCMVNVRWRRRADARSFISIDNYGQ